MGISLLPPHLPPPPPAQTMKSALRKAVMDHISDSFLETNVPLLVLIEAAKSGNEKEVKEYAQVFREHANKLVEVSEERPED
ncbi:Catenin alpha-2 [Pteropus alecto]|uniref:Catenin alpha-2 n=1 Tax=Pteropus alecto TaxID=9402 RepID=L5L596_PTEAL|nr:Catenin alpha-2 [Pteropus alecto]